MRRRLYLSLAICVVVGLGYFMFRPKATTAKPSSAESVAVASPTLPIKKVVLFSSGVGYFERRGEIDGNSRVDLTFQVRDINDLIKSMVVQDEKGTVGAVSYDSMDPVERTLKSFSVNLTNSPTLGEILNQLRGEKVEVVMNQSASGAAGTVTGSIMGREPKFVGVKDSTTIDEYLNLWCADGIRELRLSDVQRIRFLNPATENEFRRALDTLAQSHDAQKKSVSLSFSGEGKRDVSVGYVVESPIWKTSYRLVLDKNGKPFLQGWAVVDNPTDDDWTQVSMALISGRPVSFEMDLYKPLYVARPMEQLDLFQSLRPVAYDGATRKGEREELVLNMFNDTEHEGKPLTIRSPLAIDVARLRGQGADGKPGMNGAANLGRDLAKRMDVSLGVHSAATASQLGDFFQYLIDAPVNLPRQKSALLPVVNKEIEAQRLSIYNPAVHPKFPMLGLKLKNTSGLHLMQGPITVFEGSVYAGDARISDISPNDDRLISYAVDLGTEVEAKRTSLPQMLTKVVIENGVIMRTDKIHEELTYTATNRSGQPRTLWIEHPYRPEFKLVSPKKPVETTRDDYRFEMALPPKVGQSVSQVVIEERDELQSLFVTSTDDRTIQIFISDASSSPEVKKALQKALELKARIASTGAEFAQVDQQIKAISDDQARLCANIKELPTTSAAYKRYLDKFDKQETQIESLRERQKSLQQRLQTEQKAIDDYLLNLNAK